MSQPKKQADDYRFQNPGNFTPTDEEVLRRNNEALQSNRPAPADQWGSSAAEAGSQSANRLNPDEQAKRP